MKKTLSLLIKNNPIISNNLNSGSSPHPRRDDVWGKNNYLDPLCNHGENTIFISDTDSNHIYVRSFESMGQQGGVIFCLYKQGAAWIPVSSKVLNLDTFITLLNAANSIGAPDNIVFRFLLENIDKFEGVLTLPNIKASTAGNFAVSAAWDSILDHEGKKIKAKTDGSGVGFA